MPATSIEPTFPIFTDIDGQPLEDGFIWIGTINLDPQTNPIAVFSDAALTIPLTQPVRTIGGYPASSGTPIRVYANSDYSIRVMNKNGSVVYSAPSPTARYPANILPDGSVTTPKIANDAVTFAKTQNIATQRILGRTTAGSGDIEELTGAQAAAIIGQRLEIQPISASVAANALTVSASALTLDFRSTTLGSGAVATVSGTPANLTVPSGATLGTVNAVQSDIVVLALNNAGTIELAVVNLSGGVDLSETGLISTTAISAGSTSASTVYSTTGRTNVAYRVIGVVRSTQATAGTWATAPSLIQGSGGMNSGGLNVNMRLGASVATTSGTAIDVTGIPAWAKRITVIFYQVSTNGANNFQVQIGSGSVSTSGYASYVMQANTILSATSGFIATRTITASDTLFGSLVLNLVSSNQWVSSGIVSPSATTSNCVSNGGITLGGALDRIRLTTVGGTDTFDGGNFNIVYEG
jgi:hypothetical protein